MVYFDFYGFRLAAITGSHFTIFLHDFFFMEGKGEKEREREREKMMIAHAVNENTVTKADNTDEVRETVQFNFKLFICC